MERFALKNADTPGYWMCWDSHTGLLCRFQEQKFNDTQKTIVVDFAMYHRARDARKKSDALFCATAAREMADWLLINHPEKLS